MTIKSNNFSPYITFSRKEWATLRAGSLAMSSDDFGALAGLNEPLARADLTDVHLPLSYLLQLHVAVARALSDGVAHDFLHRPSAPSPYVIAIAGSVAVGKSTLARLLRALLAQGPDHPRVDLITTDGFLYPTRVLEERGLMRRKGFPESYDRRAMLAFLVGLKAGKPKLQVPVYSHEFYDLIPGRFDVVDRPDIVIFEGLNVLQTLSSSPVVASDFFDFSIYLDADTSAIQDWYVHRFLVLQQTIFQRPTSFFHMYKDLTPSEAKHTALELWRQINLPNLEENIRPTRERARLILRKGRTHRIEEVRLRRT